MTSTNKLLVITRTLSDGGKVFDGQADLDLQFVTMDDAASFAVDLALLVAKHTNNTIESRLLAA